MTFISYAQNFEDVMLWRALKHVPAGKYIDVGAQDPVVDSVSKAFYDNGWRGIHVEPVPRYAEMLRQDRPDETVLQLALSDQAGILELNVFEDTGLSTGVKEFSDNHRERPDLKHQVVATPMLPMSAAFASLAGQPVHWLKIDVEGLEEAVLRGWDSQALRPWIIVIEATVPMSTELRFQGAEDILLAAGYEFVYFDGLNRFYVAAEHPELKPAFAVPPNVFDDVRLSGLASSELCRGLMERHRSDIEAMAERHRSAIEAMVETHRSAIEAMVEGHGAEIREIQDAHRGEIHTMSEKIQVLRNELVDAVRRTRAVEEQARIDGQAASATLERSEFLRNAQRQQIDATLNSTSWRITAPMRAVSTAFRRLLGAVREGRLTSGIKRRIKSGMRLCALGLVQHPRLKSVTVTGLKLVPPLNRRVRAMLAPPAAIQAADSPASVNLHAMSPATQAVFLALKAVKARQ